MFLKNTIKEGFIMKKKFVFGIVCLLIIGSFIVSCDLFGSSDLDDLVGTWKGSYINSTGETGLTLNVYKDGSNYKATFEFYNLPGKSNSQEGKYYMNVTYNQSTNKFNLKGYEWINRPGAWVFVDLEGNISGNTFSGTNSSGSGRTFSVTRQ